jgi:hypothetical protein
MAFISQPPASFPLLTYQTLRDWGIEKSHSYEKLQNGGEDERGRKVYSTGRRRRGIRNGHIICTCLR